MRSEGKLQIPLFANWVPDAKIDTSFLASASDITTRIFTKELLTPFLKVINEKYL